MEIHYLLLVNFHNSYIDYWCRCRELFWEHFQKLQGYEFFKKLN